jgi:hypothetical protein
MVLEARLYTCSAQSAWRFLGSEDLKEGRSCAVWAGEEAGGLRRR